MKETTYLVGYDLALRGYVIVPSYHQSPTLTVYRHGMTLKAAAEALPEVIEKAETKRFPKDDGRK